ncbi:hypothetical protein MNBD_GAMMA06-468 [hydrothermal vent metagenome]|uniref:Outer membrane protein beta-barrel domain-containing protein n=1 Tax=hydrothermal vent metagenome TaxID=652676 RepID=A0A3B0X0U1_9ZZZZ
MLKFFRYFFILILLVPVSGFSGSGLYFGVDTLSHKLRTQVAVNQTFSDPPPEPINVSTAGTEKFSDLGIRIGYKYKRRLKQRFFLSPELMVSQLDDDFIYGSNLKIGVDIYDFSVYGTSGISHINQFDKNQFNYGLGMEYKISHRISFNLEWQQFTTITENTVAIENFGAQVLTTTTDTQRDISVIKLGITIYLHE